MNVKLVQAELKEAFFRNIDIFVNSKEGPLTVEKTKDIIEATANNLAGDYASRMVDIANCTTQEQLAIAHIEMAAAMLGGSHLLVRHTLNEAVKMLGKGPTKTEEANAQGQEAGNQSEVPEQCVPR